MSETPSGAKLQGLSFKGYRSLVDVNVPLVGGQFDQPYGLVVITGHSDAGKSNVVRGVRALLNNEAAGEFLTWGENTGSAALTLQLESGKDRVVTLTKGKKANDYRVEEAEMTHVGHPGGMHGDPEPPTWDKTRDDEWKSVGSGCPADVQEAIGMGELEIAGEAVEVHVASQHGPRLGVDDNPARLGRIIGGISGGTEVYAAVARGNRELREATASQRAAEKAAAVAVERLEELQKGPDPEQLEAAMVKVRGTLKAAKFERALAAQLEEDAKALRGVEVPDVDCEALWAALGRVEAQEQAAAKCRYEAATIHDLAVEIREGQQRIEKMTGRVKELQCELAELQEHQPTCPECGAPVDDEGKYHEA
jgi:energy-coupling factor transporter ATP-binding protein EcfA2